MVIDTPWPMSHFIGRDIAFFNRCETCELSETACYALNCSGFFTAKVVVWGDLIAEVVTWAIVGS
jgi:hypothetical protein